MDRLKSVLADKIIEIASENNDSSKIQLDKLNRFRDFSYACEALIKKYPRVEDELIRMIETNDFDTRIASSRVNNIISYTEDENSLHAENHATAEPILPETEYANEPEENTWKPENDVTESIEDAKMVEESHSEEEIAPTNVEEIQNTDEVAIPAGENSERTYASSDDVNFEYSEENKTATNFKRIMIVLAVVAGIVVAYYLIKFVIHNWQPILIVLGVIAAAGGAIWLFATKKNNDE